MHLPPSGDPRWRELAAPVLDLLRSLPDGAGWPALTAWMRRARWTVTRMSNALAWLEGAGLARSTGGREVRPGLDCSLPGRSRVREERVGVDEPVRWHAVAGRPAVAPQRPEAGPCPVVRGPAPPAALPPLRGPFLGGRPASPPPPVRRPDPGSRDPGSGDGDRRRLPSEERALRAEVCAPRIRSNARRRPIILATGEPAAPPLDPRRPAPEVLREVRKVRHREAEAAKRERARPARVVAKGFDLPRPGVGEYRVRKREAAQSARQAWLASGPSCSACGAPFGDPPKPGRLPKRCAACRPKRKVKREVHPPLCGCAECG